MAGPAFPERGEERFDDSFSRQPGLPVQLRREANFRVDDAVIGQLPQEIERGKAQRRLGLQQVQRPGQITEGGCRRPWREPLMAW